MTTGPAVCYLGPFRDHTGYGEANRHAIAALHAAGCDVKASLVSYVRDVADFGKIGILLSKLEKNEPDYRIKILHTTPDQFKKYIEPGKYHIAHFFWETSKVPSEFVEGLRLMNEIWTGSEHNKLAMERSGVNCPIVVMPQAIETTRPAVRPYSIDGFNGYLFYSIFEWIDRKNPEALIAAYWDAFQKGENVGLLLKTYFKDFTQRNKDMIRDTIAVLRRRTNHESYPPIFLYRELMDRHQITRIHDTGDCFVSAHRGEGWGVPQVEAMLRAKPVVSTNCGGVHEYLDRNTAILLPFENVPVSGMSHSNTWYTEDQSWAEVNHEKLVDAFKWAYENQKQAESMGKRGQEFAIDRFNLERVGTEMRERLEVIGRKI